MLRLVGKTFVAGVVMSLAACQGAEPSELVIDLMVPTARNWCAGCPRRRASGIHSRDQAFGIKRALVSRPATALECTHSTQILY